MDSTMPNLTPYALVLYSNFLAEEGYVIFSALKSDVAVPGCWMHWQIAF